MGTEWVIPVLGLPILGCLILLVVLAIRSRVGLATENRVLGLGRGRLAAGYLGALAAALVVSAWMTRGQLTFGLESGNYAKEAASSYAVGLFLYYFIALAFFVILLLTVVGLPVLAGLRRMRLASTTGAALAAALIATLLALWWHAAIVESIAIWTLVAVGFSLAARLPPVQSHAMRTNNSLERSRDG